MYCSKDVSAAKKRRAQRLFKKAETQKKPNLAVLANRLLNEANRTYHAR